MLYLIHEQQRKKVIAGYYSQVWKSFTVVFLCICMFITALAIPTIILLQTEVSIKVDRIASLKSDINEAESKDFENEVSKIENKTKILRQISTAEVRNIYIDLEEILGGVQGVRITSLTVDGLAKNIELTTEVRDKEVAKNLVDVLQKTRYKGAVLSYSVLSEKSSFVFKQNLLYE